MSDNRRIFTVTAPELTDEMVTQIPQVHDGKHFELFYNLIFNDIGFTLPDHLRPVAWAIGDSNIKRLMIIITGGSGKSQLSAIAYPLWELGLNNNLTIMGVSAGADLMLGWLQESMNIIEGSEIYNLLFPTVVPDKERGWSNSRGAFIRRTAVGQAEPSYSVAGIGSKLITGKHAQLIIIDDIHNDESVSSADQIQKVENFWYQTMLSRQDPRGCRMVMIGRRWTADDLYGRLKKSGDWCVMTLPAVRETPELYWDVRIPAGLSCVWNDFQPNEEVEDIKVVYGENTEQPGFFWKGSLGKYEEAMMTKKNLPTIFEASYQANPEAGSTKIFNKSDFRDFAIPDEMYIGRNYDTVADYMLNMQFDVILQTWDTAMTAESQNDPSVCYTIGLRGCTKNHRSQEPNPDDVPFHFDIYVLDEIYKRLTVGDLKQEAIDYHAIWNPNYVLVENSIAGVPLIQSLQSDSIQVVPVVVAHTNKRSRATNGAKAGSAQGWAKQGNILVPQHTITGHEVVWAKDLLNELNDFTGAKGRRDDRVDALIQAVNFAINLGVQSRDLPEGWRDKADIDAKMLRFQQGMHPLAQLSYMYEQVQNPFYGMCGGCKHFKDNYCKLHERAVPNISSCPMFATKDGDESQAVLNITYGNPTK